MAIPGVLRSCRRSYAGVFLRLQDRNLQLAAICLSSHRLMFERGSQMRRTERNAVYKDDKVYDLCVYGKLK